MKKGFERQKGYKGAQLLGGGALPLELPTLLATQELRSLSGWVGGLRPPTSPLKTCGGRQSRPPQDGYANPPVLGLRGEATWTKSPQDGYANPPVLIPHLPPTDQRTRSFARLSSPSPSGKLRPPASYSTETLSFFDIFAETS